VAVGSVQQKKPKTDFPFVISHFSFVIDVTTRELLHRRLTVTNRFVFGFLIVRLV